MQLETPKNFSDFELLDSGNRMRLERWGKVVLARPDPQIIWQPALPQLEWDKAWAIFRSPTGDDKGRWDIKKSSPKPWVITFKQTKFLLKLSPFKHTGIFAEQAAQWEWMLSKLSSPSSYKVKGRPPQDLKNLHLDNFKLANKFKVLNLFAYTGAATMVLAKAGCHVTHVDASKPAITWANENQKINGLPKDSIRWILDDAVKFVKREVKRGSVYDGIIMDPPAFGHSPTGKTWKFNHDLPGLLADCSQLLSAQPAFVVINGYATNSSALSLHNILEDTIGNRPGTIEFGELCLKQKNNPARAIQPNEGRMISTGIFARWSNQN